MGAFLNLEKVQTQRNTGEVYKFVEHMGKVHGEKQRNGETERQFCAVIKMGDSNLIIFMNYIFDSILNWISGVFSVPFAPG